jgi:hypothetical protein
VDQHAFVSSVFFFLRKVSSVFTCPLLVLVVLIARNCRDCSAIWQVLAQWACRLVPKNTRGNVQDNGQAKEHKLNLGK